ncbi:MAG: hypothetical protein U0163_07110 [Gemmatimonadaceae bacterium]
MILDDDHQVIHLSVHLAWSHILSFGAWRSFRDIGAVLNGGRVDWTRVEHAARAHGATSCCYWTLRLASQLSGIDVPAQALAWQVSRAPTPWGVAWCRGTAPGKPTVCRTGLPVAKFGGGWRAPRFVPGDYDSAKAGPGTSTK